MSEGVVESECWVMWGACEAEECRCRKVHRNKVTTFRIGVSEIRS